MLGVFKGSGKGKWVSNGDDWVSWEPVLICNDRGGGSTENYETKTDRIKNEAKSVFERKALILKSYWALEKVLILDTSIDVKISPWTTKLTNTKVERGRKTVSRCCQEHINRASLETNREIEILVLG